MTVTGARAQSKNLILAAMIFAVAMTFIDQTIVSIAAPEIQKELGLTSTGVQWAINAYLLSLAALFALGGRLADTLGHRRMVVIGVIVFAGASALCGATPNGAGAEAWIVTFRAIQGAGGALMFPAALAIVVNTFELRERGKALASFFGIAGALTAVGPVLGGYLTEWTWRAIFWVNIPVAIIALVLIFISKPQTLYKWARLDYRGAILIAAGVGLSVFGFQQSATWGWSNPAIGLCIGAGVVILIFFYFLEIRTPSPLIQVSIFKIRAFLVQNIVLGVAMLVFVPVFFFASEYAQISLGYSASKTGVILLYFFIGFVITSQIGGRLLDASGAKLPVVLGCVIGAVGFGLWASKMPSLSFSAQQWYIIIAGGGVGFMLGPASTDAGEPRLQAFLRRSHRHHPDGEELRGQPGPRHPRDHPGHRNAQPGHHLADLQGCPSPGGCGTGRQHLTGVTRGEQLHQRGRHPSNSSGPTSPTPAAPSSTSWPGSWL